MEHEHITVKHPRKQRTIKRRIVDSLKFFSLCVNFSICDSGFGLRSRSFRGGGGTSSCLDEFRLTDPSGISIVFPGMVLGIISVRCGVTSLRILRCSSSSAEFRVKGAAASVGERRPLLKHHKSGIFQGINRAW
ncbi:unnamed protein product [Strongylus vulgaris]|uniref:Uncharacterized protein n=1 Tax=Strongylus vulgaris TaxID=40348 RepID=A0A3P7J9E3_STRVU|nr:unnamed protein product [Strongylus vulgaris]